MVEGCGCEKCKSAPPVVDAMIEELEKVRLLGETPYMVAIRAEDFAAVELWLGHTLRTIQDIPIYAVLGRDILSGADQVACLEEYREDMERRIGEGARHLGVAPTPVHGLLPEGCFVFTVAAEEVPRSD